MERAGGSAWGEVRRVLLRMEGQFPPLGMDISSAFPSPLLDVPSTPDYRVGGKYPAGNSSRHLRHSNTTRQSGQQPTASLPMPLSVQSPVPALPEGLKKGPTLEGKAFQIKSTNALPARGKAVLGPSTLGSAVGTRAEVQPGGVIIPVRFKVRSEAGETYSPKTHL